MSEPKPASMQKIIEALEAAQHSLMTGLAVSPAINALNDALSASRAMQGQEEGVPTVLDGPWKFDNKFLPFHPEASHVLSDYRDGWNACWSAMQSKGKILAIREQQLGNLLARVFRDGGQYIDEYGWEVTCADAEEKVVAWLSNEAAPSTPGVVASKKGNPE